jgi:voltage-gated potassium channel
VVREAVAELAWAVDPVLEARDMGRIGRSRRSPIEAGPAVEENMHPGVPAWRQQAFDRFSATVELPMLVLTLVMVPILIIPFVADLAPGLESLLLSIDYFIWAIFAVEYLVRLVLAPRRRHFFVHNLPDLVVVAVPMLRPLRIVRSARLLRFLRLGRLTALAGQGTHKSKRSLHVQGLNYVLVVTGALVLVTSLVVYDLERQAPGSTITSWPDGLWWALSTVMTVGYGDKVPVTAGGRAVAVVLMVGGIALLGVITAAIAATFVAHSQGQHDEAEKRRDDETEDRLVEVLARVTALEASLSSIAEALTTTTSNGGGTVIGPAEVIDG